MQAIAEPTGLARLRAQALMLRAMRAGWQGAWAEEDRLVAEAFALREAAGDELGAAMRPVRAAFSAVARGLGPEWFALKADAIVRTLAAASPLVEGSARAWADAKAGRLDDARARIAAMFDGGVFAAPIGIHALESLSETAWLLGDRRLAGHVRERLLPHAGRAFMVTSLASILTSVVDHALMRLADVLGLDAEADAWAASALAFCARLGAEPLAAAVRADHAALVARRGAAVPRDEAVRLTREGEVWTVVGRGEVGRVKDSRGLRMLARLVAAPGVEVHALDLSGGGAVVGEAAAPALDQAAKKAYRARLAELESERAEADAWHDELRRERVRAEIERLERELARAFGLGGRARPSGAAVERARVNVRRRLVDALERIAEVCPTLGADLARDVQTGVFCRYQPKA
ncbi:MAG: hypothetical protein U1F43_34880 [Myxococcota bacterium]